MNFQRTLHHPLKKITSSHNSRLVCALIDIDIILSAPHELETVIRGIKGKENVAELLVEVEMLVEEEAMHGVEGIEVGATTL